MAQAITQKMPPSRIAPGPPWYKMFHTIQAIRRDFLQFMTECNEKYGDIVRYRFGPVIIHYLRHPDAIQYVLQTNHRNYGRSVYYDQMKLLLGEGLLTSDGDFWLRQRRLIQPAFHRKRLETLTSSMIREIETLLERWREKATQESFDMVEEMMHLALCIASRTLFHLEIEDKSALIGEALTWAQQAFSESVNNIISLPIWAPLPRFRKYRWAIRTLDTIVKDIIQQRRADTQPHHDLLAMLLELRDEETGEAMSDNQVRDEVMTLLLAGHETTGNQLSWTWYLLSQHPEIAEQVHEEAVRVLGDRTPTTEDIYQLTYTKQVLQESMRLYPPAWAMDRKVLEDDEIQGYHVPKNSVVFFSTYTTHRHPEFWDEPEVFRPDRFSSEASNERPRYAYFPFGGGPRQCIGNHFAMMESTLAVAMIARDYRIHLKPGHPIGLLPLITLRPRFGLHMSLESRSSIA